MSVLQSLARLGYKCLTLLGRRRQDHLGLRPGSEFGLTLARPWQTSTQPAERWVWVARLELHFAACIEGRMLLLDEMEWCPCIDVAKSR